MYEFHAWATIADASPDGHGAELRRIVAELQEEVQNLAWSTGELRVFWTNGSAQLLASGSRNRSDGFVDDIHRLFRRIAADAPGSFGLLYAWDDEDEEQGNQFRVWVLRRGGITLAADPFLSPCVPTIQDG